MFLLVAKVFLHNKVLEIYGTTVYISRQAPKTSVCKVPVSKVPAPKAPAPKATAHKAPKEHTHKELNILLLGETGVGKSTWINGFANYLTYPTLDEAEDSEFISLIPSSFTLTDENYIETLITTGVGHQNEIHDAGESATQYPKTYRFCYDDVTIRLIDTPGIGDTRGIDKDKENFNNILAHIATLDELHGICILLKPNAARLTVMFQYCIKELLANLHKDACSNIVICFTNSRGTFYVPGDTMPSLRKLIEENKIEIHLSKEIIYCVDNEAVRFLAARKSDMKFKPGQREDFAESWNKSVEETERLVEHIDSVKPHLVRNTQSINDARRMIISLIEPLANITTNIEDNVDEIKVRKQELLTSNTDKIELAKNLYIPRTETRTKAYDCIKKVCASSDCMKYVKIDNVTKIEYKCIHTSSSKQIKSRKRSGHCKQCACDNSVHKKITYEMWTVATRDINSSVQQQIFNQETAAKAVEENIKELEQEVVELTQEQTKIIKISAKFACFLQKYAITPYNDAMDEFMDYYIKQETDRSSKANRSKNSTSSKKMKNLIEIRSKYNKQVKDLEAAIKTPNNSEVDITSEDVKNLIDELYAMKHLGDKIRNVARAVEQAELAAVKESEVNVKTKRKQSSKSTNQLQTLFINWH